MKKFTVKNVTVFCLVIGHKTRNKNNINEEYFTDAIFIGENRKKNLEIMKYMVCAQNKVTICEH